MLTLCLRHRKGNARQGVARRPLHAESGLLVIYLALTLHPRRGMHCSVGLLCSISNGTIYGSNKSKYLIANT